MEAILNAVVSDLNNGVVEETNNKIKMVKRGNPLQITNFEGKAHWKMMERNCAANGFLRMNFLVADRRGYVPRYIQK